MIDWTKPIEWVWNDIAVPCELISIRGGYPELYPIMIKTKSTKASCNKEGFIFSCEGQIRNVQQPAPLDPTATWWAKRWWQSATDAEKAAMRVLAGSE